MSSLLDLLEPLDWPRQAATGAGEGALGLLGGDFTWKNALKLLPAIAGVGAGLATGGLAAAPVGSLVAALTQGLGKSIAPQTFEAPTTGEMVSALGGDEDSFLQNLAMGVATDPLTYTGIGLGRAAGKGLIPSLSKAAPAADDALRSVLKSAPESLPEMTNLRRGIGTVFFNPDPKVASVAGPGREIGERELLEISRQVNSSRVPGLKGFADKSNQGTYVALKDVPSVDAFRPTRRHEMYHGLIKEGLRTGETAGLSPLQRAATGLYSSTDEPSLRGALAVLLDEMGAHAAERTGPLSQLAGGANFLFGAHPKYAEILSEFSPTVARLYRNLPYVPEALGGIGGLAAPVGIRGAY